MANYEFIGPDPIDHFHLGRVSPGDVVASELPLAEVDAARWKTTKRKPSRASDPQPSAGAEQGSDVPDSSEEV